MGILDASLSRTTADRRYLLRRLRNGIAPGAPIARQVASSAPTLSDSGTAPTGMVTVQIQPTSDLIDSSSVATWAANTSYLGGQVVSTPDGVLYRLTAGTSASTWASDASNWLTPGKFARFCAGGGFKNNNSSNGWTATHKGDHSFGVRASFSLLFGYYGTKFVLKYTSAGGNYYRVSVDGQYVSSFTPSAGVGGGATRYLTVDFTALGAAARTIKIDIVGGDVWALYVGATDSLWAVDPRGPRVLVVGDSYSQSATAYTELTAWPRVFADYLGLDDVWNSAIGGSGFLAGSGSTSLNSRYATDLAPYSPDVVIYTYGHNDNPTYTPAQCAAVLTTALNDVRSNAPGCLQFVMGPFFAQAAVLPSSARATTWAPYEDALMAAAAAVPDVVAIPTVGAMELTGTGTVSATTGSGNGDLFLQADGVHPTAAGSEYLAYRRAHLFLAALDRL